MGALATFYTFREIARALPGVVDGTSYGTPALKVGGKLLARLHQSMDCVVLRSELLDREILVQSAPDAFFITLLLPRLSLDSVAPGSGGKERLTGPDRTGLAFSRIENLTKET